MKTKLIALAALAAGTVAGIEGDIAQGAEFEIDASVAEGLLTEGKATGGSYARVAVTSSLANWAGTQSSGSTTASSGTSGTTSNNGAINFPTPSAGWGAVVSARWWDASTSGNAWVCVTLAVSKTINTGDTVSFPAGSLTFQIDN